MNKIRLLVQAVARRTRIGGKAVLLVLSWLAGALPGTYGQDANPKNSAKATTDASRCAVAPSVSLGNGEPGLKIDYKTTNYFVIYLDEPGTVGPGFMGGYDTRHITVLLDRNYGLKEKIQMRQWDGNPEQLYAFDQQMAFTCEGGAGWSPDGKIWNYWPRNTQFFSAKADGLLVSDDVYTLARTRYGLTKDQLFLGAIGTNIFYWETRDPKRIYFRSAGGQTASNYFVVPKGIVDIFGVTKGVTRINKDLAFVVFRKSTGFFHYSPYEFNIIEFSYKDTKRLESNQ